MHSWHWALLSLFSPLFLFHCSQVECFLPSHFALAAVQLGRVRHSNSSNLHSSQAKIHPCHQKNWSAMFRSFICWTLRSLVMEPHHFHFVAVPKVLFFFFGWSSPLRFWLSGKTFQKWNIPGWCQPSIWNLFCYFRSFFLPRFLPRQLLRGERIHFPNLRASMNIYLRIPSMDIYLPIYPRGQAWICTHKFIQKASSK